MADFEHSPPTPGCIAALIPAAGRGERFGSAENKLFAKLDGQPIWMHSAIRLRSQSLVGRIVMAVSGPDRDRFENDFAKEIADLGIELVLGGAERTDSVRACLDWLSDESVIRYVAVHDAARPLVAPSDLASVFAIASQTGAALLATPMPGTVKRSESFQSASTCQTVDRRGLWIALTPQVFRIDLLQRAYSQYRGRPATDDAELVERTGVPVTLVPGSAENIKITLPEDLLIAEAILKQRNAHA